jgi:DNA-binding Xre family transcriptional regulator
MYESHNLATAIKTVATSKDIVIKTMLKELNLGSNTMSALYHGKSIAFDSLARIADYLDCSVDYLLGRTDKPEVNR